MFRIVALLLLAVLIVPGALYFPYLWSMVIAAPAWLWYIFRLEERRIRATLFEEVRATLERLPVE